MKTRVSVILLALILAITGVFSSCGKNQDKNIITYIETDTTTKAEVMFKNKAEKELIELCQEMSIKNEDAETRDNFFMYILAKTTDIDENNQEDLYILSLNVMERCLKLPISSATVVNGLRKNCKSIDEKLTEKTKEFLVGQWIRKDNTSLADTVITVENDPEMGLISKITSFADNDNHKFKINDIKWKDIHFASYKKFYFSDLASEETITTSSSGEVTSRVINTYKGAVAKIDFEKNTVKISYTIKTEVTSGANQTWVKVGYENSNEPEESDDTNEPEEETEQNIDSNKPPVQSDNGVTGFFEE